MHTYRKRDTKWQVGYYRSDDIAFEPCGPLFGVECEAAAYASFLNGGRYNPYEIEALFRPQAPEETDDDAVHPARPRSLEDYPLAPKAK